MFNFNFFKKPSLFPADVVQPLTNIPAHTPVTLTQIIGGRKVRHRLTALGLVPGVEIEIVQNRGGALLVAVHNTRLALGRTMASKIMVQP